MPFIALVSMASMVDLLRFRPALVANLVARMPSGFPEAAREEVKPGGLEFSGIEFKGHPKSFCGPCARRGPRRACESPRSGPGSVPLPRRPGSTLGVWSATS